MNSSVETILLYTIAAGLLSIVYGYFTGKNILSSSAGNSKMQEIASAIQIGAKAYLARQYKTWPPTPIISGRDTSEVSSQVDTPKPRLRSGLDLIIHGRIINCFQVPLLLIFNY